jgi:lysophospholipid acyltransferase (LPLAT)-like uncharacterized protein
VNDSTQGFSYSQRITIAIVPRLVAFLLRVLNRTLRYEVVVESGAAPATPPALQVWCFWHRCLISCACYFHDRFQPAVLISRSFDGELIARTIERLGFLTARGSSTRSGGSVKLAQLTGYSIGIFYAHPEKAWLLRSWDQFMIPKPFSRVAISWGRHVQVPKSEDPALIEAKRLEVEEALERARLNAERHFLKR